MKAAKRIIGAVVLVVVGAALLLVLALGFVVSLIAISDGLGFSHALGIDTQQSENYDFVSGVGPMIIAALGFSGIIVTAVRHLNCECEGCWRLGHRHPGHGRPVCRKHYHKKDIAPE